MQQACFACIVTCNALCNVTFFLLFSASYANAFHSVLHGAIALSVQTHNADEGVEKYLRSRTPANAENPFYKKYLSLHHGCSINGSSEVRIKMRLFRILQTL